MTSESRKERYKVENEEFAELDVFITFNLWKKLA
jgi:hypothetical protein